MDGLKWKTLFKMDDLGVPLFLETPIYIPGNPKGSLVLIGKDLLLEAKQRTNGFQIYCIFVKTSWKPTHIPFPLGTFESMMFRTSRLVGYVIVPLGAYGFKTADGSGAKSNSKNYCSSLLLNRQVHISFAPPKLNSECTSEK